MDISTLPQAGGIYQWRQLSTGRKYVGSTNSFPKRYGDHLSALKRRNHYNAHLNRAWSKYGAEDFMFEVLEIVDDESLLISREQWFLDNKVDFLFDFNQAREAGKGPSTKGRKQVRPRKRAPSPSLETIEKRALKLRGKKRSQATIDKVSVANRGKTRTKETRERISDAIKRRGIKPPDDSSLSDEAIKRKYSKGSRHTEETRQVISRRKKELGLKTFLGKSHTDDSKRKMSEKHTGTKMSEETKKKMSESQKKRRLLERRPGK